MLQEPPPNVNAWGVTKRGRRLLSAPEPWIGRPDLFRQIRLLLRRQLLRRAAEIGQVQVILPA